MKTNARFVCFAVVAVLALAVSAEKLQSGDGGVAAVGSKAPAGVAADAAKFGLTHNTKAVRRQSQTSSGGNDNNVDGAGPGSYKAKVKAVRTTAAPADGSIDGTYSIHVNGKKTALSFPIGTAYYKKQPRHHSVQRYSGGSSVLTGADVKKSGCSHSCYRIFHAMGKSESGSLAGTLNTWDGEIVSWGFVQFAGAQGTLGSLMCYLKSHDRSKKAFQNVFVNNGIDVECGRWLSKIKFGGAEHQDALRKIKKSPDAMATFLWAGQVKSFAMGQIVFWRIKFFQPALGYTPDKQHAASQMLTDEYSSYVKVYSFNWLPTPSNRWFQEFIEKTKASDGVDLNLPSKWTDEYRLKYVAHVNMERSKKNRDDYKSAAKLGLSTQPGSFEDGRKGRWARCQSHDKVHEGSCVPSSMCKSGATVSSTDGCRKFAGAITCCLKDGFGAHTPDL